MPRASNAVIPPARTSPVPAVARDGSPLATINTGPSGAATMVVAPLWTTTAPHRAARVRVAWTGSSAVPSTRRAFAAVRSQHGRGPSGSNHIEQVGLERITIEHERPVDVSCRTGNSITVAQPEPRADQPAPSRSSSDAAAEPHSAAPRSKATASTGVGSPIRPGMASWT